MALGIKNLQEIYKNFRFIESSYNGMKTNWNNVAMELNNLLSFLNDNEIRNDDNFAFNYFVACKLREEITQERNRVHKIIARLELEKKIKGKSAYERFCPLCGKRMNMTIGIEGIKMECNCGDKRLPVITGDTVDECIDNFDKIFSLKTP